MRRGGARASGDEGQATSGDDDHDHEGGDEVGHSRSWEQGLISFSCRRARVVEAGAEGEGGEDSEVAATSGVEEEDSGVDSGLLLTIIVEQEWDLDHGILY